MAMYPFYPADPTVADRILARSVDAKNCNFVSTLLGSRPLWLNLPIYGRSPPNNAVTRKLKMNKLIAALIAGLFVAAASAQTAAPAKGQ